MFSSYSQPDEAIVPVDNMLLTQGSDQKGQRSDTDSGDEKEMSGQEEEEEGEEEGGEGGEEREYMSDSGDEADDRSESGEQVEDSLSDSVGSANAVKTAKSEVSGRNQDKEVPKDEDALPDFSNRSFYIKTVFNEASCGFNMVRDSIKLATFVSLHTCAVHPTFF